MQYFRMLFGNVNALFAIILTIVVIITITNWGSGYSRIPPEHYISDIFVMKRLTPNNKNIFFIETSCVFKKRVPPSGIHLNSRQVCSLYSAAKLNPTRQIILYHSCPLHSDYYERSSESSKYLLKLPNVYVFHVKYENLLRGTFVEEIVNGDIQNSLFPIEHSSDVLRLLLVYKYGGAYMDLDFISQKPLDTLAQNFIVAEDDRQISNGIFQFAHQGQGNVLLKEMLIDMGYNYNGKSWAANGPELVKRNFVKFCNLTENVPVVTEVSPETCGISVYKPQTFFPIHFREWKKFFKPGEAESLKPLMKDSYAVHFWNFLSKNEQVIVGENSVYESLANEYCKEVIMSSGSIF